jgi:hypothetical protein
MLPLGRENGESWAKVSRVRVSKMLWEPNTTVKERVQRATSERIVMMRVGLVMEAGIVRIRFSLFFLVYWTSSGGRNGEKRVGPLSGVWKRYERQRQFTWLRAHQAE